MGYSHVYSHGYFHGWDSMVIQWMTGSLLSRSSTQSTGLGVFSMSRSVPWIAFCANSPRCFNAKSWSSMTWMSSGYLYFIAVGKPTGHREVAPREFDVHSRWKPTREAEEKRRRRRRRNEDEDKGMHVFWTWAPFFWTCTCFLDLAGFFLDLGARKMWGMRLCVSWTLRGYFFGPACICAGPRDIF